MMNSVETELAEKKAELEKLSVVLEEKERGLEEFTRALEQFQQRFSAEVGQKQIELDALTAQLAELTVKKSTNGRDVNQRSSGFETHAEKSADGKEAASHETRTEPHTIQELKEVKKFYRKIASVIHPDKATEEKSRPLRTKLMAELNEAYVKKDTMTMQHIFDQWTQSPESVAGDDSDAELERTRRSIAHTKKRLLVIDTEMSRIKASTQYVMMLKAQEAEKEGRDILAEMTMSINAKIKDVQSRLVLRMYG